MSPIPNLLQDRQLADMVRPPMGVRSDQARLRLRAEMSKQKLSQRELADLLQWSQSRVAKILTGRVELGVDDLDAVCFALGLSVVEAVRDHGFEFCAEMTPTELRLFERLRSLTPAHRDAILTILDVRQAEARRAAPKRPHRPPRSA